MKQSLRLFLVCFFALMVVTMRAQQTGGRNDFNFLRLPASAQMTALGGYGVSASENRPNIIFQNPALIDSTQLSKLDVDYHALFSDTRLGTISKVFQLKNQLIGTGVQFVNYGNFQRTDEAGQSLGTFNAMEYQAVVGTSYALYEKLTVGAHLKAIGSNLESYNAFALAASVGALYQLDSAGSTHIGLQFENMGYALTYYEGLERQGLPFNISMGITHRLKYLPFRYTITYRGLQKWNVLYDDPNTQETDLLFGNTPSERSDASIFFDNLFRHIVFAGEFMLGKEDQFRLRAAFDYGRRSELESAVVRSMAGISLGFGIRFRRFSLDFGKSFYHLAGGTNHLSLGLNL